MKLLASSDQVDAAIAKMAADLIKEFNGTEPLFVALLRGAAPFASKLMFEIARQALGMHPELDYMTVSAYGDSREAGILEVVMDISPTTEVKDRTVIVVDDVLDRGITSSFVTSYLFEKGAKEVKIAVLVEKDIERVSPEHADFACFHSGPEWLTGMGMDDASVARDGFRWLDEIRIVS